MRCAADVRSCSRQRASALTGVGCASGSDRCIGWGGTVLMYLTGRERVDGLSTLEFVPGALADHLTSFGGMLDNPHGQMSALAWIDAGATATYGTTSEPCAHLQKFRIRKPCCCSMPGASAIEAYWKSAMAQQGLSLASRWPHPLRVERGPWQAIAHEGLLGFSVTGPIAPELQSTISSMASATAVHAGCGSWLFGFFSRVNCIQLRAPGRNALRLVRAVCEWLEPRFQVPSCRIRQRLDQLGKMGPAWGRLG